MRRSRYLTGHCHVACGNVTYGLCALIRLRNAHHAYQGEFSLPACGDNELALKWQNGAETALLHVDFTTCKGMLQVTENGREPEFHLPPRSTLIAFVSKGE